MSKISHKYLKWESIKNELKKAAQRQESQKMDIASDTRHYSQVIAMHYSLFNQEENKAVEDKEKRKTKTS